MLLYHGGSLFGKLVDDSTLLVQTLLGLMMYCFYGGTNFFASMLPISKLNSNFLIEQADVTTQSIRKGGGTLRAVACDENGTNRDFLNGMKQ